MLLPSDNICFRVRTNHLGMWSPSGRGAWLLSNRSSLKRQPPPDSPMKVRGMLLSPQHPGTWWQCQMLQNRGRTYGHSNKGRQLFPSWLYLVFLPLFLTCWDVNGTGLIHVTDNPDFLLFALTLLCWQKRGVWLSRVSIHTFPPFHQWSNLSVAWISVPIAKALPCSQWDTARHSKTPAPALFNQTYQSASFCLGKFCRRFSKSCKLPWGYTTGWDCMTDQFLLLLPSSMFQLNPFSWWMKQQQQKKNPTIFKIPMAINR